MKRIACIVIWMLMATPLFADDVVNPDPWEGFNRKVFAFNDTLDTYALRPVAKGYRALTPDPVEDGIARIFSNLGELLNIANDLLQGKFGQAGNDTGRILVNTTIGIAGFFDVANKMGLEKSEGEDFGQTLAVWGVGSGPYLMLPLFGPSTLRDGPSRLVDRFANPINEVDHIPTRNTITGTDIISNRAGLLDAEEMVKGDKYSFIRDIYLQRREHLVKDGEVEDDFGDYDDYSDYDD